MVAVKFQEAEAESLRFVQSVGIEFKDLLGTKATAQQIGNRKSGKPDAVMGDGTFAFLEQLTLLAQKDAGIAEPESGYSQRNMALIEKYIKKQGLPAETLSGFMTHLTALVKPEEPAENSLFRRTYSNLSARTEENTWRVAADRLSPPIIMPTQTVVITGKKLDTNYDGGVLKRAYAQAATPAAEPSAARAPLRMSHSEYEELKERYDSVRRRAGLTSQEIASIKAYETAYDAVIKDRLAQIQEQRQAILATQTSPASARKTLDSAHMELTRIDLRIKDRTVTVTGPDGKPETAKVSAILEKTEPRFFTDTRSTRAYREAVGPQIAQIYADLKESEGYNRQRDIIAAANTAYVQSRRPGPESEQLMQLRLAEQRVTQQVQGERLALSIPAEQGVIMATSKPSGPGRPSAGA